MERHIVLPASAVSVAAGLIGLLTLIVISTARLNIDGAVFGGVVALLVVASILGFAALVSGMMLAACLQRWDWLVGVLILGPVGALLLCLVRRREVALT